MRAAVIVALWVFVSVPIAAIVAAALRAPSGELTVQFERCLAGIAAVRRGVGGRLWLGVGGVAGALAAVIALGGVDGVVRLPARSAGPAPEQRDETLAVRPAQVEPAERAVAPTAAERAPDPASSDLGALAAALPPPAPTVAVTIDAPPVVRVAVAAPAPPPVEVLPELVLDAVVDALPVLGGDTELDDVESDELLRGRRWQTPARFRSQALWANRI